MPGQRPTYAQVAETGEIAHRKTRQRHGCHHDKRPERFGRKTAQAQGVEDIPDVFKKQGPIRAVQGVHLAVSPHFVGGPRIGRYQEKIQQEGEQDQREADRGSIPLLAALQQEGDQSQDSPQDDHRMQADQPALEKISGVHRFLFPAVVVRITDDEPREDKEEIDGQIPVVEPLVDGTGGKPFEDVVPDHHQGSDSPQTIQEFIMGFGVGESGGGYFLHGWFLFSNG